MTAGCVLLILSVFWGDMWIKNRIERQGEDFRKEVWGRRILLRKYHNKGAMLNLGQNRKGIVAAVSVILSALLTMIFLLSLGNRGNHLLRAGLSLLLGGAFSNTYDRLKRQYVVDYFSIQSKWKPLGKIVFNISDFCIIIGAMLTVIGV